MHFFLEGGGGGGGEGGEGFHSSNPLDTTLQTSPMPRALLLAVAEEVFTRFV